MSHLNNLFAASFRAWGGIQYKSERCLLPCTVLSAHATYQQYGTGTFPQNFLGLFFEENIAVEEIALAYDSTALLVEIGSCLGLWLGLSVVGVYDLLVLTTLRARDTVVGLC